jgi:putative FmdB family regulatory protein
MPTYEYACSACRHQWEQVQRIVEAPIEVCPQCSAKAAHRLISGGTNFILKGGGWYSDLYSSSKAKAPDKAADGGSGSTAAAASTGTGSDASSKDSGTKTETKTTTPSTGTSSTPSTPSTPSS